MGALEKDKLCVGMLVGGWLLAEVARGRPPNIHFSRRLQEANPATRYAGEACCRQSEPWVQRCRGRNSANASRGQEGRWLEGSWRLQAREPGPGRAGPSAAESIGLLPWAGRAALKVLSAVMWPDAS